MMVSIPEYPNSRFENYMGELVGQESAELPPYPMSRGEAYLDWLVKHGTKGGFVSGYFYNGQFYEDAEHTKLITPEENTLYLDSDTGIMYRYKDGQYSSVSGGIEIEHLG